MKKEIEKKKLIQSLSGAVALGVVAYFATGWPFFYFFTYAGKKKKQTKKKPKENKNAVKWFALRHTIINHPRYENEDEYERGKAWCLAQPVKDWYIRGTDGVRLHASYLPAEKPERFIVMCHGYRGTWCGSMGHMAEFLHKNNCSLLMIDQRGCEKSGGRYITFGAKEKVDVTLWLERLEEINVNDLPIYLYGQSMGATTVLLASGLVLPENVHGIIADCGFSSMKQQLKDIASGWFHLHFVELLLVRVDFFCRLFAGFSMRETKTTHALKKNKRPVLFFHGAKDTYVWPENSRRNYDLCKAEKELVIFPKARHLCCSYVDPELYQKKMTEFFRKYDR